jgi:hypothetical protein
MLKRVQVTGFIEVQEGAELPELGQVLTISEMRVEVTGEHKDKQKRRGDAIELVYTRKTTMLEGASILKVEEPEEPLFDPANGDPTPPDKVNTDL